MPVQQQVPAGFTKNCPRCGQYMNPQAYVCPYCKKKLRSSPFVIGCFGLLAVLFAVGFLTTLTAPKPKPKPTPTAGEVAMQLEAGQQRAEWEREHLREERARAAAEDAAFKKSPAGRVCAKHPGWSREACETIAKRRISIGMNAEQVRASWGKPSDINRTTTLAGTREQWVYGNSYVYLDEGVVTAIQN